MQKKDYVRSLTGTTCPACQGPKAPGKAFCWPCFSTLSHGRQIALYSPIGQGYERAFDDALAKLTALILTLWQPWASFAIEGSDQGFKDVENRSWPTPYRGPLLIHAGLTFDPDFDDPGLKESLPKGVILGAVDLVDCVRDHPSEWANPGAWHWVLKRPRAFEKPTPYKGRQGLWRVPIRHVTWLVKED